MTISYECKHFDIRELVPRHVYEARGNKSWELLDDRLLMTLDDLREDHGSLVANTWFSNEMITKFKYREWSGLRTIHYWINNHASLEEAVKAYDRSFSQHKYGRAGDCLAIKTGVDDIRNDIILNPEKYPYIKGLEMNITWLHVDTRNCHQLKQFNP